MRATPTAIRTSAEAPMKLWISMKFIVPQNRRSTGEPSAFGTASVRRASRGR